METKVKGIVQVVSTEYVVIKPESKHNDRTITIAHKGLNYSLFNIGERVTYKKNDNNGRMEIEIRSEDNPGKCISIRIDIPHRNFINDIER